MTEIAEFDADMIMPDPHVHECPDYEEWPDEWQGQGAMGETISGGALCYLGGGENPSCHGNMALCVLIRDERTKFFYCTSHGIITDARVRHWDNGDPDPLNASVWEDYCPRCGIECLPLAEWLSEFWEDHP